MQRRLAVGVFPLVVAVAGGCAAELPERSTTADAELSDATEMPNRDAARGGGPLDASAFDRLDSGIYWFRSATDGRKADDPASQSYVSASAPTMIYVHGWNRNATPARRRDTFRFADSEAPGDVTVPWRRDGWNLGIFYWNQFSDEPEVKDVEAKVWTANGPQKMRWRVSDGSFIDSGISKSVTAQFVDQYLATVGKNDAKEVRLMGFSLGAQVVIAATYALAQAVDRGQLPERLLPRRIALLDPAFLQGGRDYLNGRWPGEVARDYVDALKARGVIFESLRSSGSSSNGFIGDTNIGLLNKTAFRELKPWYFGPVDFVRKHSASVWHYLWEYGFAPAAVDGAEGTAPSASASNGSTRALMNASRKYQQIQGQYTKTPADDAYDSARK